MKIGIMGAWASFSGEAVKKYGLETLEKSVQDLKFNYTSFIVAQQIAL